MPANPGFISSAHYLDYYGNPINNNFGFLDGNTPLVIFPFKATDGTNTIKQYDPTNFDTEGDVGQYFFKEEDFLIGRSVTVTKVVLVIRDLGTVDFDVNVIVYNPLAGNFPSIFQTVTFVGTNAGNLHTVNADLVITGERPRVRIDRYPGHGPLSIISVTMITDQEVAEKI